MLISSSRLSKGFNINFLFNANFIELNSHLIKSFFYISSAGFGNVDSNRPELLEHFGITILEASLRGCIPIVYSQGGPAKIIDSLGYGYKFSTLGELEDIINLLNSKNRSELIELSRKTIESSRLFINQQINNNKSAIKNFFV